MNITSRQNRYYDIHYFFSTLTKKGFFPEILTGTFIPNKVKAFIKRIIPPKYESGEFISDRGRLLVNDEYLIPDAILKNDEFFKNLRK